MKVETCLPDHNLAQGPGCGYLNCSMRFSVTGWLAAAVCALSLSFPQAARAQSTPPPSTPAGNSPSSSPNPPATPQGKPANPSGSTQITPEQAKQLFNSVDSILQFDSKVTGLPVLQPVKRRLVTR